MLVVDAHTSLLGILFAPNRSMQCLADTETDADRDRNNDEADEDVGDKAVAAAQAVHADAATLLRLLLGLGLLHPMFAPGPNLTVALARNVTALARAGLADG